MKRTDERPIVIEPSVSPLTSFEDLYVAEYLPMVRLAFVLLSDDACAEEVVQDAFAKVYERWASLTNAGGYLRTCVVSGCRDVLRRERLARWRQPYRVEHLRRRATCAPDGDGWEGILRRVEQRHRRRQRQRIVASAACALAVLGVTLSLAVGTNPEETRVATDRSESPPLRLPHLVLDLAGYELEHVSESYVALETPTPSSADEAGLVVLAHPEGGYDGKVLFITTAPAASGYGVGDQNGSARPVDVNGRTAWLQQYTALPSTSLGWYLSNGRAVHLVALRMGEDELLAAARNLVVAEDGTISWEDGSFPAGLSLERRAASTSRPRATAEVRYRRGDEQLALRLQQGGDAVLDDLIRDRAAAAIEIGGTTVAGVPAVLSVYDGSNRSSLMWSVRPGVVAELVGRGIWTPADMKAAATSVREIDEAEWQDLLERFAVLSSEGDHSEQAGGRASAVMRSMCELKADG